MKDSNVRLRISNFFNNIFDEMSESDRKYYIDLTYIIFLNLRSLNLFSNDTLRISQSIANTCDYFDLW